MGVYYDLINFDDDVLLMFILENHDFSWLLHVDLSN